MPYLTRAASRPRRSRPRAGRLWPLSPALAACAALWAQGVGAQALPTAPAPHAGTMTEILAGSPSGDWRALNPQHTLYLNLPAARVVIELLPALAPRTVANIEALARMHYYDGLAILRVQDNFVAQWGDADGQRPIAPALRTLAPEFTAPLGSATFVTLPDRDGFAAQAGFIESFPAARDQSGRAWLAHCYGAIGVGRGEDPDSGNGSELYAVIGHAPRQLDRNVTVVGRVRAGIEWLAALPRGGAEMGFYAKPEQRVPIASLHLAAEVPPAQRVALEVLRSDSATFAALVAARRDRHDAWYVQPAGYIDLCNVPLPVRARASEPRPKLQE